MVDKFVGDELVAQFFPLMSGERHVARAVAAAQALLQATGHSDPGGPWVPVGAGIHVGQPEHDALSEDAAFAGSQADGSRAVDEYIAALPEPRRGPMTGLRRVLVSAAPAAAETIAYKMPALRLNGAFFMSYDAYKRHYSLFPATDRLEQVLGDEIAPYLAGKGTLRFKADEPLPLELIRRAVEIRLEDFPHR